MTSEDKKEWLELMKSVQKPVPDLSKIVDWLFKALIGVLVWIGSGVKQDVDIMKQELTKSGIERQYQKSEMQSFKEFIKEPRFTKGDFDAQIMPLTNQVNRNTSELNARGPVIDGLQEKFIRMESKIDAVLEKLKEE